MPYVNVRIAGNATAEQKEEVIAGITEVLQRVLDKRPEATHVVIDEVDPANWGNTGKSIAAIRREAGR